MCVVPFPGTNFSVLALIVLVLSRSDVLCIRAGLCSCGAWALGGVGCLRVWCEFDRGLVVPLSTVVSVLAIGRWGRGVCRD